MYIDQAKQNRPSLIARDFELLGIPKKITYYILLRRGVFKWLACREDIIRLKNSMKNEIRALNREKTLEEKGYLMALEKYRKEIKIICHSPRLRVQTNDHEAARFLVKFKKFIKEKIKMELEDQKLLFKTWQNSRKVHKLDFPEWLKLLGFTIESVLVGDDADKQKKWLEIMRS